ncbi:unnamed protein product [Ilex paraguariensis]|uniref:Ubiquitin-like domain-containing protein n=1 Tax=Ilex paraguariensis TaxID=185542 RepID=A0ABC8RXX8_9AQUA
MVGFSVSDQSPVYAGNLLEDSKTLACYDIKEEAISKMLPSTIQIFVKKWNGETTMLEDGRDLASYGIQKHSTLHQIFYPSTTRLHQMNLSEITDSGPSLPNSTTILNLKHMIAKVLKTPVKTVFLGRKPLRDYFSLADYVIQKSTVLVVALQER